MNNLITIIVLMSFFGTAYANKGAATKTVRTRAATAVDPGGEYSSRFRLIAEDVPALEWELGRRTFGEYRNSERWNHAENYCASKGHGWRLPTVWELYALSEQKHILGQDQAFDYFWSSTSSTVGSEIDLDSRFYTRFVVKFSKHSSVNGFVSVKNKYSDYALIRCVRDLPKSDL